MIKNRIISKVTIAFAVFVVIFFLSILLYQRDKNRFLEAKAIFEENIPSGIYDQGISWYFFQKFEGPKTLSDIFEFIESDYQEYYVGLFQDPFCKKGNALRYIPLYNPNNFKRESYLLISAGIDGVINTNFSDQDTIFQDSIDDLFYFYKVSGKEGLTDYNLFDRFFGQMDYLVHHVNFVDQYKGFINDTIDNFHYFIDQLKVESPLRLINKTYIIELNLDDIILSSKCYIRMDYLGYIFHFKLYDCIDNNQIVNEGKVILLGKLQSFDLSKKEVEFVLCMKI